MDGFFINLGVVFPMNLSFKNASGKSTLRHHSLSTSKVIVGAATTDSLRQCRAGCHHQLQTLWNSTAIFFVTLVPKSVHQCVHYFNKIFRFMVGHPRHTFTAHLPYTYSTLTAHLPYWFRCKTCHNQTAATAGKKCSVLVVTAGQCVNLTPISKV